MEPKCFEHQTLWQYQFLFIFYFFKAKYSDTCTCNLVVLVTETNMPEKQTQFFTPKRRSASWAGPSGPQHEGSGFVALWLYKSICHLSLVFLHSLCFRVMQRCSWPSISHACGQRLCASDILGSLVWSKGWSGLCLCLEPVGVFFFFCCSAYVQSLVASVLRQWRDNHRLWRALVCVFLRF